MIGVAGDGGGGAGLVAWGGRFGCGFGGFLLALSFGKEVGREIWSCGGHLETAEDFEYSIWSNLDAESRASSGLKASAGD